MKEFFKALSEFIVGIVTAFIVSNKSNVIFWLFKKCGINNSGIQNTFISLIVTFMVTMIGIGFKKLFSFLTPVTITIETDQNKITFTPQSNEYTPKKIKFTCKINPGGYMTMLLLQKLGAALILSFNPENVIMDIEEDARWSLDITSESSSEFQKQGKEIYFNFLNNYNVKAKKSNKYTTSVRMEIVPDRIKDQNEKLNYSWDGHLKLVISRLCRVKLCEFETVKSFV